MKLYNIAELGWDDFFGREFDAYSDKGYLPARVIARMATQYRLLSSTGECTGLLSGKYLHAAQTGRELPVVGDWVAVEPKGVDAIIHAMLPRKTCFARKPAISGGRKLKHGVIDGGMTARQVLAANIDTIFIVSGLDGNYSAARTERFLTIAAASGVMPVLLLNKGDLSTDVGPILSELNLIAKGIPAHVVSALSGLGMDVFSTYFTASKTVVFLGSSGVGKSTLINRLFGQGLQSTNDVNETTGKGRHTTTRAELLVHESGCMLIDTSGIRELQLWCDGQAVEESFDDVAQLASQCRFSDCRHGNEPGCAIRAAIQDESLSKARYQNYMRLNDDVRHLEARKKQRDIHLSRQAKYSKR